MKFEVRRTQEHKDLALSGLIFTLAVQSVQNLTTKRTAWFLWFAVLQRFLTPDGTAVERQRNRSDMAANRPV